MGWVILRKMGFGPKWEKVAYDLPISSAAKPNHLQFGPFYGLQWEVFHCRLIAQSHRTQYGAGGKQKGLRRVSFGQIWVASLAYSPDRHSVSNDESILQPIATGDT
jgi:hypothetical protein